MAALAEEAPAAFVGVVEPVIVRQGPGVDAVDELERLAAAFRMPAQPVCERREAAVEPDGDQAT